MVEVTKPIKRNGVYFVKASCVRTGDSQNHAYEKEIHQIGEYEQEIQKLDECTSRRFTKVVQTS